MANSHEATPNDRKDLRRTVTVTLLRRISLVVAASLVLATVPASASGAPAGVTPRQERAVAEMVKIQAKLAHKLESVGPSCKSAAKIVKRENAKHLSQLLGIVGTLDMKDPEIKTWIAARGDASSRAIRDTEAWQACQSDPAFAGAVRKHPLLKYMTPDDGAVPAVEGGVGAVDDSDDLSSSDINRGALSLNAYRTLSTSIGASKDCAAAARVIKRDIGAKARTYASIRGELLLDPDAYKATVFEPMYGAIDFDLGRFVQICKSNTSFMTAARVHPFLKAIAITYDARPSVRPRAVTKKLIAEVDMLRGKMRRQAELAGMDDGCDDFQRHLIMYGRARDKLLARIGDASLSTNARTWLGAYTTDDFLDAAKSLMPDHVCRTSDGDVAAN